ncbi:putative nuclease HARBI1 [Armigeres subalbatus]|uniref:putative nuclease HARBI1 n=1 Tax=Armigeres subalbatus TaxID=124917 RepID=UPI002ED3C7F2
MYHRRMANYYLRIAACEAQKKKRRIWSAVEKSTYWEADVPKFSDYKFKNTFRVDRKTMAYLVTKLYYLRKEDTCWRWAISLEKRIAIAMYALGSSAEYRTVASLFGVGRTTVGELVLEFCDAVIHSMQDETFTSYPPTTAKIEEITSGFLKHGFPQCYGAVDGCHIEVSVPKNEAVDYYNFKGWHSVVLFAAVDYRYRFTYINVGVPGRSNDSTIFENSALKSVHDSHMLFRQHSRIIDGLEVPILLIGDSAFKLSPTLMKPFPFIINQSEDERLFNYILSRSRRVVENAFGHLKARFRKIGRGLEVDICNANRIIKTSCILHNLCNDRNDKINKSWILEMKTNAPRPQPQRGLTKAADNQSGMNIRRAITRHLAVDNFERFLDDSG